MLQLHIKTDYFLFNLKSHQQLHDFSSSAFSSSALQQKLSTAFVDNLPKVLVISTIGHASSIPTWGPKRPAEWDEMVIANSGGTRVMG